MDSSCSTELLEHLLHGELPEPEAASLRTHLAICDACRVWLDSHSDNPTLRGWVPLLDGGRGREPALDQMLQRLGRGPDTPADSTPVAFLEPPAAAGELGRLGPYRVHEELGRGGMGIVLRAFDETLQRPVALKVLRPDLADGDSRARLLREAQLAARFRHEHVVLVHAVVQPPGGLPYLVLEYVDGQPLSALLKSRGPLDPAEAVGLIVQAADGLAAAHAAGLVHRDVKPGNLLIETATDKVKVADFGLARVEAHSHTLTPEGTALGTPVYMSPEQARAGNTDARTDVYSLGVTLYESLTGEVPFRGSAHLVIQQVIRDDPPSLRRLNDRIPRDLETICLKAMAKEPARRYPSARELADDLRRWQCGEPIRARPAGAVEHLWRWCRRNPRLAVLNGAVAGLLIVIAAGSALAAVVIGKARDREVEARIDADKNAKAARQAEQEADANARAAGDHFNLALNTLNMLIDKVQKQLVDKPGTLPLRQELVKTAVAGLEQIARSAQKNRSSDASMVAAHHRLGDLFYLLGKTPEARAQFDTARSRAEAILPADPDNAPVRRELAGVLDKLGNLALYSGDALAARTWYGQSLAIRQALVAADPANDRDARELMVSLNKMGDAERTSGGPTAARKYYEEGLRLCEARRPAPADRTEKLGDLHYSYRRLGLLDADTFDFPAARASCKKSLQYARAWADAEPDSVPARREVEIALGQLGNALLALGEFRAGENANRKALAIARDLAAAEPANAEKQRDLAGGHSTLADLLLAAGDLAGAREAFQEATAICERQADRDRGSPQRQGDYLLNLTKLADTEERAGRYTDAARWLGKALAWCDGPQGVGKLLAPSPIYQVWRAQAKADLAVFNAAAVRGFDDVSAILKQPRELCLGLLRLRALSLARGGRHAEAAAAAELLRGHAGADVTWLLFVGRTYALCSRASVAPASPGDQGLADRYAAEAFRAFGEVIKTKPALASGLPLEPDFLLLRQYPGYHQALQILARAQGAGK